MGILPGKRALIVGVATERSIAWGIAEAMHAQGAELAFSYANDKFRERVEPLAALYARSAVLREGFKLVVEGHGAMNALIERTQTRRVAVPGTYFANVNTPADLRRARRIGF